MIKKFISVFLCAFLLVIGFGCTPLQQPKTNSDEKISIVTTLFATYDFTKNITGELCDVTLLLAPGVESHTYEPSPADIIKIKNADLFIYTGKYMESWASGIINDIDTEKTTVADVSENIILDESNHSHAHDTHSYHLDPHIWTSPLNAQVMVQNILDALTVCDPANAQIYKENASAYITELETLDSDFENMINASKTKKIMFGGRFAMNYFAKRYGIEYISAYDSCTSHSEPSAKLVANIIDEMKVKNIGAVYYEELSNHSVADQIALEADAEALLLHSCHNVSRTEYERGETYISLMRQNLENLKKGLKAE